MAYRSTVARVMWRMTSTQCNRKVVVVRRVASISLWLATNNVWRMTEPIIHRVLSMYSDVKLYDWTLDAPPRIALRIALPLWARDMCFSFNFPSYTKLFKLFHNWWTLVEFSAAISDSTESITTLKSIFWAIHFLRVVHTWPYIWTVNASWWGMKFQRVGWMIDANIVVIMDKADNIARISVRKKLFLFVL